MNQLKAAYAQIMKSYASEGLTMGALEWIGFSGKWTAVFAKAMQNGIAFNFTGEHELYGPIDPKPLTKFQPLVGKDLSCLAKYLEEKEGILYDSLYLAVLNALSNPLNQKKFLQNQGFIFINNDFDFVKWDDFVTVIGAAGFIVNQLRQRCEVVHVSDMRKRSTLETLYVGEDIRKGPAQVIFHDAGENERLLAHSDIVMITGSTLVNRTIFDLLPMVKKARVIGMFGPSAMLSPVFLFQLGVNYIVSSHIKNPGTMREYFYEGFCGKKFEECMENYSIIKI